MQESSSESDSPRNAKEWVDDYVARRLALFFGDIGPVSDDRIARQAIKYRREAHRLLADYVIRHSSEPMVREPGNDGTRSG